MDKIDAAVATIDVAVEKIDAVDVPRAAQFANQILRWLTREAHVLDLREAHHHEPARLTSLPARRWLPGSVLQCLPWCWFDLPGLLEPLVMFGAMALIVVSVPS